MLFIAGGHRTVCWRRRGLLNRCLTPASHGPAKGIRVTAGDPVRVRRYAGGQGHARVGRRQSASVRDQVAALIGPPCPQRDMGRVGDRGDAGLPR